MDGQSYTRKLKEIDRNSDRQDYSKYRKSEVLGFIRNNTFLPIDPLQRNTVRQLQILRKESDK